MADKKVEIFAIKVDLDCGKCRKKIKKVLCEIPQIHDQRYDEKNNVVIVKVVCCSPDKVKKMICCKGGKTVKGIEIVKPPPPDKPPKKVEDKPPPVVVDKPPPVVVDKPPPVVVDKPPPPGGACCRECSEGRGGGPCWDLYRRPCYSNVPPGGACCRECSEGRGGGPCYSNERYAYGRPVYDSWGGGSYVGYNYGGGGSRCVDYICEENPSGCSIM